MRTAFVVSALAFIVPALSAPTVIPITKHAGPVKQDYYIVKFKNSDSQESALSKLGTELGASESRVIYNYAPLWDGIAVVLKGEHVDYVRRMPEVESMEEDSILSLAEHEEDLSIPTVTKHNSLLSRADDSSGNGAGVTVYGIDTGIYTEHDCFGGRAMFGASFVSDDPGNDDYNGHGTHTAGTAVGKGYSVAEGAQIFGVKVLNGKGSGAMSGVLAGVQWACKHFAESNKPPSIATMSLGGTGLPNSPLNQAIEKCIEQGLHFTIAAGNSNVVADTTSPANTLTANTVGAVDAQGEKADKPEKASFSNYGRYIDIWAPGVGITSAWIGGSNTKNTISGTSMATPGVASILAVMLSKCPALNEPQVLSNALKKHAIKQVTFTDQTQAAATPEKGFAQVWDCNSY